MSIRPIKRIVEAKPTIEGAGVKLRRAFGFGNTHEFDPFLLFDDFRNESPEDFLAGFPWHPHRGIETITYVLAGTVDHADSLGNRGSLGAGDVQWMTAGSGILHQEMPQGDARGRMHGFQLARIEQQPFDLSRSEAKMRDAISRLSDAHPSRAMFERERANVAAAVERGESSMIERAKPASLVRVRHTAKEFAGAKAADLRLEFVDGFVWPISVKTEKSNKVAVAEGQTPEIGAKWAGRYFRVSDSELEAMTRELGFATMADLKSSYLNVAGLVARILIRKLSLVDCKPADFSRARVTDLDAAQFLFRQLLKFKHGNDSSTVIIFDRTTGEVNWESRLEAVDIEHLTPERISFRPSRPRAGQPVSSEFGIKIDGRVVVTFQIKHRRGAARGTARQFEFSDITTRLMI